MKPSSTIHQEASLYIHVPFCAGACDYCDFYSVPLRIDIDDSRLQRFIDVLLTDAHGLFETYKPCSLPSLYIGGGTPSVLGASGIHRLLEGLLQIAGRHCPPPIEVTVEANPESADEAFLSAARDGGATRLSLGLQSFHAPSRQAVGRIGATDGEALLHRRLALAAQYFPAAFSGDLISGLPLQGERVLLDDIAALHSYRPAHVSLYALTVEPETPLAVSSEAKSLLPPPDEADCLWLYGRDALERYGYSQYEVSSFCLAGKESLHNVRYWRMQNWLALGPAASATVINDETGTGFRYTMPPDVDKWFASRVDGAVFEALDTPTLIKESFLMGFRYIEGPDEGLFRKRFCLSIGDCIPETLTAWGARGLLQKNKVALTKEGLLFLHPFLLDAFAELDVSIPRGSG